MKNEKNYSSFGFSYIKTYLKCDILNISLSKNLLFLKRVNFFLLKVVNGNEIQQTSQLNTKENLFPVSRRNVHTTITATPSALVYNIKIIIIFK